MEDKVVLLMKTLEWAKDTRANLPELGMLTPHSVSQFDLDRQFDLVIRLERRLQ
jgi:hypothetical protein